MTASGRRGASSLRWVLLSLAPPAMRLFTTIKLRGANLRPYWIDPRRPVPGLPGIKQHLPFSREACVFHSRSINRRSASSRSTIVHLPHRRLPGGHKGATEASTERRADGTHPALKGASVSILRIRLWTPASSGEANRFDVHRTTHSWDIAQPTRRRRCDVSVVACAARRSRGLFRRTGCKRGFDRKRSRRSGTGQTVARTVLALCR